MTSDFHDGQASTSVRVFQTSWGGASTKTSPPLTAGALRSIVSVPQRWPLPPSPPEVAEAGAARAPAATTAETAAMPPRREVSVGWRMVGSSIVAVPWWHLVVRR